MAKALVDECIQDWSAGSRDEIKVLVNDSFYVDKTDKINTQRILGLRRLNIEDEKCRQEFRDRESPFNRHFWKANFE